MSAPTTQATAPASTAKFSLFAMQKDFKDAGTAFIEALKADGAKESHHNQLNTTSRTGESHLETLPHLEPLFTNICFAFGVPAEIGGRLATPAGSVQDRFVLLRLDALAKISQGRAPYNEEELKTLEPHRLTEILPYMGDAKSVGEALKSDAFLSGKTVVEDDLFGPYCASAAESSKQLVNYLMTWMVEKAQEGTLNSKPYLADIASSRARLDSSSPTTITTILDKIRAESAFEAGLTRGGAALEVGGDLASTSGPKTPTRNPRPSLASAKATALTPPRTLGIEATA